LSRSNDLHRALRTGQRYGDLLRAFRSGERFGPFEIEKRSVGRLAVTSNRVVVCDPFSLGFGFSPLERRVPRGQFPVVLSVAHTRKGKRKGEARIACAMIRFGDGEPVGFKLAGQESLESAELLGTEYSGYAVQSGFGCFADEAAAKALQKSVQKSFSKGELDPPAARNLRQRLAKRHAPNRSWAAIDVGGKATNLVAFTSGWGDGCFPSYWGYDDDRRLACLVTDFLVLPTRNDLIRSTWQGPAWREFHYEGDRGDHFWRVRIQENKRQIRYGRLGEKGQTNEKDFATSDMAYASAAKRIGDQTARGFYEVTLTASRMREAKSKRSRAATEGKSASSSRKPKAKAAKPKPAKAKSKPKVAKAKSKPKVAKSKSKPKVAKAKSKPKVAKAKSKPKVAKSKSKPTVAKARPKPKPKAKAAKAKPKPKPKAKPKAPAKRKRSRW
jgi:predicted DNA-binding WGR domain protein